MSMMFYSCSSLTSLDLRNFDTSKVTNMRYMFDSCSKLTQITVSNKWVIKSATLTTDMFYKLWNRPCNCCLIRSLEIDFFSFDKMYIKNKTTHTIIGE